MTTIYQQPQFNGYAYQLNIDFPDGFDEGISYKERSEDVPNQDGIYDAGSLYGAKRPVLKGRINIMATGNVQTDLAANRTAWDNFKAVHAAGTASQLYIDSDRYLNCSVVNFSLQKPWNGLVYRDYEVRFLAADPFWYAASGYAPLVSSSSISSSAGGIAGTYPPTINTLPTLGAPGSGPVLTSSAGSTSLSAGIYYMATTYVGSSGQTTNSPVTSVTIASGGAVVVSSAAMPSSADKIYYYMSVAPGSIVLAYVAADSGAGPIVTALPNNNVNPVTSNGNAYALPVFTFNVLAVSPGNSITVYCGNYSFVIYPSITGTWIVDCTRGAENVTVGGVDYTAYFTGVFPRLLPGSNNVMICPAGGIVLSSIEISWQDRWV